MDRPRQSITLWARLNHARHLGGVSVTYRQSPPAKGPQMHAYHSPVETSSRFLTLRLSGEHVKSGYRRRWGPRRAGGTRHEQTGVPSHAKHQSPQPKGTGRSARIEAKRSKKSVGLSRIGGKQGN